MKQIEEGQAMGFDRDTWSGKTCPEHSARTKGQTSEPSCKKRRESSSKKPPLFLFLKRDGLQPDASMEWVTGGDSLVSHGAYSMLSFGESPSVAVESHLSQILEDSPLPKYYLSAKACQGILRRAERRGKELPQMLKEALYEMIAYQESQLDSTAGKA